MTNSPCSLDEARAANPDLGFALYAMTPGGPVTLEIFDPDGQVYRFDGPAEADVMAQAFPPDIDIPISPPTDIFD